MEPPPFAGRRATPPIREHQPLTIKITTPFPTHAQNIHDTVPDAVEAIIESSKILWEHSESDFDRLIVVLTRGKTQFGTPLIWPYLFHRFKSQPAFVDEPATIQNDDICVMDAMELEDLYQSANISQEIQHLVKTQLRSRGFTCTFSDLKLDLNNFQHWRMARLSDYGIRSLDNDPTVRCLVLTY